MPNLTCDDFQEAHQHFVLPVANVAAAQVLISKIPDVKEIFIGPDLRWIRYESTRQETIVAFYTP